MAHEAVMPDEVIGLLVTDPDGVYVDGTLGEAGHASLILERLGPAGRLIGVDRDPEALDRAAERLAGAGDRVRLIHGNFRDLATLLPADLQGGLSGVLLDLGLRSTALDDPARGFSFRNDGPLDMRFDPGRGEPASRLLARMVRSDLERLLEEGTTRARPRRLAQAIVDWRRTQPLATTGDLVRCLRSTLGRGATPKLLSSVFSAVRMAVNEEMADLDQVLRTIPSWLKPGGVLCVLAYQSQEDRRVKGLRRAEFVDSRSGLPLHMATLTRRPMRPALDEVRRNRRARSAKLRAFARTASAS